MRFYGFQASELTTPDNHGDQRRNLDLQLDPKLSWALRQRAFFPVDLNRAPRESLLRIPGIGVRNVQRILRVRRLSKIRLSDLIKMRIRIEKCLPFIETVDHRPGLQELESEQLHQRYLPAPTQTEFHFQNAVQSATHGEL